MASPTLRRMALLDQTDRRLIGLTLLVKLAVLVAGALAYVIFEHATLHSPEGALAIWNRWDGPHYLDIAAFGYTAYDPGLPIMSKHGDLDLFMVFYPLYPWVVGGVNRLFDDPIWSAFAVTTIASLFVAPLLYRLVREDEDPGVAWRAAWFLLIFPTAYFLHIGYTEALFMALVLGSFLAARTDRWWVAGLLGGLAALTRINGMVLVPALAAEAWSQWLRRSPAERRLRAEWLAIGLVPVGFAIYLAVNQAVYGSPFAFLTLQRYWWYKSLALPWDGIATTLRFTQDRVPDSALMYGWMELLFVVIGLAATAHAALRFRPSWFAWMAGNWLLFVSTSFVLSVPRYSLTLFPLYVSLGLASRRWWVLAAVSVVSAAGMIYFAGRFAAGHWAF